MLLINWRAASAAHCGCFIPPVAWRGSSNAGNFLSFIFLETFNKSAKAEEVKLNLNHPTISIRLKLTHTCCTASSKHWIVYVLLHCMLHLQHWSWMFTGCVCVCTWVWHFTSSPQSILLSAWGGRKGWGCNYDQGNTGLLSVNLFLH